MPDSAALSVLVLAWDEAAPAVRTVIEAAPSVGSLLVLLPPTAPASAELAHAPAPALAEQPAPATAPPLPAPPASQPPVAPLPADTAAPGTSAPLAEASAPEEVIAPIFAAAALPPATVAEPDEQPAGEAAASATVRVVHLPATLPPSRPRSGAARVPAAPYLGATPAPAPELPAATRAALETDFTPGIIPTAAGTSFPTASATPAPTEASAKPAAAEATTLVAPLAATPAAAPAAAPAPSIAAPPELLPVAENSAAADAAPAEAPLADMAFRADEIVDPDPMQELQAMPAERPAATLADAPVLSDLPPAPRHGPFGLRLPELAAEPATPTLPGAAAPDEQENETLAEEPAAPAPQYPAPNLNAQIIRYARQAVPTALASGPFEVLYAPAWPTWLAAVELRQRSGRPLVLYLPALEAGRQPADTAAGWPAEIQRQALRQADLVLVDTHALARRLRRELGLASSVVRVLPSHDAAAIARALRRAHRR